jgi:protein SCO1/2
VKRLAGPALVTVCALALAAFYLARDSHPAHDHAQSALTRTLLTVEGGEALRVPPLVATDGAPVDHARFAGRWSLVFFGFTSCPDVCPTTLALLKEVARQDPRPAQIVFVTVDPQRDTRERLKSYLAYFDRRFVGLTGRREDLETFAAALGAGFAPSASGDFDHSTSLFAVDPAGRLAGVLLRPSDPARIVADLAALREHAARDTHAARAR